MFSRDFSRGVVGSGSHPDSGKHGCLGSPALHLNNTIGVVYLPSYWLEVVGVKVGKGGEQFSLGVVRLGFCAVHFQWLWVSVPVTRRATRYVDATCAAVW